MSLDITLAVGSKNPVKLKAAIDGATRAFVDKKVVGEGFNSPSGVRDQPMGDVETKTGAGNRAKHSFEEFAKLHGFAPSYALGLEGGVSVTESNELECFAWIAVYNGSTMGFSRTASFCLPPSIRDLVLVDGMELGDADDKVFGSTNAKQSGGTVGHLSNGVIERAEYYEHAVVLAFIPFHWPSLYTEK